MKNRLRVRRAEQDGMSQLELARRAGINRQRYWLIESEHAEPREDEIAALAEALDTTPDVIFPSLAESQVSQ